MEWKESRRNSDPLSANERDCGEEVWGGQAGQSLDTGQTPGGQVHSAIHQTGSMFSQFAAAVSRNSGPGIS